MENKYNRVIKKYKNRLFSLENVVGVGYGKKEKNGRRINDDAIVVFVKEKLPINQLNNLNKIPLKIEDCKTDVQEIGELKFFLDRTSKTRPAQPGISVGHYKISAGTLGAIVKDADSEEPLILSNNHVLANQTNGHDGRAQKGDPILQPGTYDNGNNPDDVIGHLFRYVPVRSKIDQHSCPIAAEFERFVNNVLHSVRPDYSFKLFKHGVQNIVDCAVAKPVDPDAVSDEIIGIGRVNGITEPEVDMEVFKSGRTSGVTNGKIKSINSTVEVNMGQDETAVFDDQIIADYMSKPGDSGSLVVDKDRNAVGLLFAGSDKATIFNKITNVMDALKIKF